MEKTIELKECLLNLLIEELKVISFRESMEQIGVITPDYLFTDIFTSVIHIVGLYKNDFVKVKKADDLEFDDSKIFEKYYNLTDKLAKKGRIFVINENSFVDKKTETLVKKELSEIIDMLFIEYDKYLKKN